MITASLAYLVFSVRELRELPEATVAELAGLTVPEYRSFERGEPTSLEVVSKIALALKLPFSSLLGAADRLAHRLRQSAYAARPWLLEDVIHAAPSPPAAPPPPPAPAPAPVPEPAPLELQPEPLPPEPEPAAEPAPAPAPRHAAPTAAQVLDLLVAQPGLRAEEMYRMFGLGEPEERRQFSALLADLVLAGRLTSVGRARGTRYSLAAIVPRPAPTAPLPAPAAPLPAPTPPAPPAAPPPLQPAEALLHAQRFLEADPPDCEAAAQAARRGLEALGKPYLARHGRSLADARFTVQALRSLLEAQTAPADASPVAAAAEAPEGDERPLLLVVGGDLRQAQVAERAARGWRVQCEGPRQTKIPRCQPKAVIVLPAISGAALAQVSHLCARTGITPRHAADDDAATLRRLIEEVTAAS